VPGKRNAPFFLKLFFALFLLLLDDKITGIISTIVINNTNSISLQKRCDALKH